MQAQATGGAKTGDRRKKMVPVCLRAMMTEAGVKVSGRQGLPDGRQAIRRIAAGTFFGKRRPSARNGDGFVRGIDRMPHGSSRAPAGKDGGQEMRAACTPADRHGKGDRQ